MSSTSTTQHVGRAGEAGAPARIGSRTTPSKPGAPLVSTRGAVGSDVAVRTSTGSMLRSGSWFRAGTGLMAPQRGSRRAALRARHAERPQAVCALDWAASAAISRAPSVSATADCVRSIAAASSAGSGRANR